MIGRVLQYLPDGSGYHWLLMRDGACAGESSLTVRVTINTILPDGSGCYWLLISDGACGSR